MFKKLLTFIAVIALVFAFTVPANAGNKDMWAQVYTWDGSMTADGRYELTKITSGITYVVMMADSVATLETLYYYDNQAMTSLANPVTGTIYTAAAIGADMIRFRVDPTDSGDENVDLIVVDQAGGYTAFVEDFNQYKHSIIIDERPNVRHHGCAFIVTTGSSSEIDTGIDFDTVSIIDKMMIEIGTGIAGGTTPLISVGILSSGTNGDADGFIAGEDVATAGFHDPFRAGVDLTDSFGTSGGEQIAIHAAGVPGVFLGLMEAGTTDTGDLGGCLWRTQLLVHATWETSLTYTFATSHASTGWGLIHFWFTRIR